MEGLKVSLDALNGGLIQISSHNASDAVKGVSRFSTQALGRYLITLTLYQYRAQLRFLPLADGAIAPWFMRSVMPWSWAGHR